MNLFLIILGAICIALGVLGAIIAIDIEKNKWYIFDIIVLVSSGVFMLMYTSKTLGVEEGAYNQFRGKYEIQYVINKDSCIIDTLIIIK